LMLRLTMVPASSTSSGLIFAATLASPQDVSTSALVMQSVRVNDRGVIANSANPNTSEAFTVVAHSRPTAYDFEPHHKNVPCSHFEPPFRG
jgi:hypothetical protein